MNTHIKELAARREGLVVEAQLQRAQAAHMTAELRAGARHRRPRSHLCARYDTQAAGRRRCACRLDSARR